MHRAPRTRRAGLAVFSALVVLGTLAVVPGAPPAGAFGTSQPAPIPSISAGGYMSCGVKADGTAACWGENGVPSNDVANVHPGGAATPPAGVTFLEVNSGYATGCGVKTDRTLACWGSGRFEKLIRVPTGQFKHVVPGQNYICALRTDDSIVCWGGDDTTVDPEQKVIRDVPSGQFSQLTVGSRHACALRADGSVRCWGHNSGANGVEGQTNVPGGNDTPGLYKSVNAGNFTSCALRADDTPVCWGRNQGAQQTYPRDAAGNPLAFTQLSTGFAHVCGLRADNTVVCWGRNSEGQSSPVPAGTYTQVTAGTFHTCAMPVSGAPARCWGNNMSGRVQPNMRSVQPHPAYVGVPYSTQFSMNPSPLTGAGAAVAVSPAPTFSLVEGGLPDGLAFSPSGVISGTPTTAGSSVIKVAASNGLSPSDCSKTSSAGDSMFCTPGDTSSLATATRAFTINVGAQAPAPGALGGRVTSSAGGAAVSGATVSAAYSDGTPVAQATADGGGSYAFASLPAGDYNLTAAGEGFNTQTKPATVSSGTTATVDFALTTRLTRPAIVGVSSNHWLTVSDGVFVEWSEQFDMTAAAGRGYSVHSQADCSGPAIATGFNGNWMGERPNSTTPVLPSRVRDVEMSGYENVVPGTTYYLRVAPGTEVGASTLNSNELICQSFRAELRPLDRSAVTGKVTSEAGGAPIAGATVTATRTVRKPGTVAGQATANASGDYRVDQNLLPPSNCPICGYNSSYDVAASAPGYATKTGSATTTFTASGPSAGSSTATVNLVLNALPVAAADTYDHNGSDTALVVSAAGVLANDTDAESNPLTAAVVNGPTNGTLTVDPGGSFAYQPDEDFVGTDSFTYRASDATGGSAPATVTITVGAGCRGLPATITGTSGNDRLTGTGGDDVIAGLGGNDAIKGAGGNDVVCGGSGRDSLSAGAGDDYADGGSGDDNLRGDVGDDTLIGGAGADSVIGEAGNDTLSGGAGSPDTCNGGGGVDALAPGHGCEKATSVA